MLRGMAQLTTGGDLIKAAIALLLGLGIVTVVGAAMGAGAARTIAVGAVLLVMVGVLAQTGLSVFGRYRQLAAGKCPNPLCHGVVQHSDLVGEGKVVCPTCKKTWPELQGMRFRMTARA